MKKTVLVLFALFMVISVGTASANAQTVSTKGEAVSSVSFRDQPSTSSDVIRTMQADEQFTVLEMVNPYWFKILDATGNTGYVSSQRTLTAVTSNATVIYGVNFRTAPSTDSEVIRMLPKGEEILVLEKVNDYWIKAQDSNGVTGYLSSSSKYLITDLSVTRIALPLEERIEAFISEAAKYMGVPYDFGSKRFETTTFDCSDLVQQAFWDATRLVLPGNSRSQGEYVRENSAAEANWRELKRGDLMFFMSYQGSDASDYKGIDKSTETITHVAIYLGNGNILHTYSPKSGGVRYDNIVGTPWEHRFLFGGSVTK